MNKETLEAIRKEGEQDIQADGVEQICNASEIQMLLGWYESGAQSKAARDYWIKWAFEKISQDPFRDEQGLIALADKEGE